MSRNDGREGQTVDAPMDQLGRNSRSKMSNPITEIRRFVQRILTKSGATNCADIEFKEHRQAVRKRRYGFTVRMYRQCGTLNLSKK